MTHDEVLTDAERIAKQDPAGAERLLNATWPDMRQAPADALHILGAIRIRQQRAEEGENLLRDAVRAEPKSLRHHIALGHALLESGKSKPALDAYAEAMRIDAKWPGLLRAYATAAYAGGFYPEAEKAARKMLDEQKSAVAWDLLSCAQRQQNKGKDALASAESALVLEPGNVGAQHSRAAALSLLGRHQEALEFYESLTARGVAAPVLALGHGAVLEKLGRTADAARIYAEATALWPNFPDFQRANAKRR
jgi:tetratricopeptide (TPR) repeat protein